MLLDTIELFVEVVKPTAYRGDGGGYLTFGRELENVDMLWIIDLGRDLKNVDILWILISMDLL